MPYKSQAQRGFMHARHPQIAARWDEEHESPSQKKLPRYVGKRKSAMPKPAFLQKDDDDKAMPKKKGKGFPRFVGRGKKKGKGKAPFALFKKK